MARTEITRVKYRRDGSRYASGTTDAEWAVIEPHLPLPAGRDRQRAFKKTSAGFNVALAVDAMTDTRSEAHEYSLRNVFPRLGETGATDDIINLIAKRSA